MKRIFGFGRKGNETNGSSQNNSNYGDQSSTPERHKKNGKGKHRKGKGSGLFKSKEVKKKKVILTFVEATELKPHGSYTKEDVTAAELPLIRSVQNLEKRKHYVIRKLRLCSVIFDFSKKVEFII